MHHRTRCATYGRAVFVLAVWGMLSAAALAAEPVADSPAEAVVAVDASQVQRTINARLLGGSNTAAWLHRGYFDSPAAQALFRDLKAGVFRLPGGSWGDGMYWNGNGVRGPDGKVDPTKIGPDGYPAVDYSDYAPSFLLDEKWLPRSDGWHGNVDVKLMHEWIRDAAGSQQMVIVNAGTGRPVDAAEWVRWANKKMGYNVRWWEIGNELDGSWELGHKLRDGTVLTAEMYARRFRDFAVAMKAVDPTILIGGAASGTDDGGFAEVMLRDAGEHVDFVSVHIYPGNPMFDDQQQIERIKVVSECARRVQQWLKKYQPDRADRIPLAITEWGMPAYRGQSEQLCTLWASLFIHEAAKSGYDLLNHWLCDALVRHAEHANHDSSIDWLNGPYLRGPEYYALWLWNHYSGDRLVQSSKEGFELLHAIATRSDDALFVTLVNTSRQQEARTTVKLAGFEPGTSGERAVVSHREYFRNYVTKRIQWSTGTRIEPISVGKTFGVTVPPFSIVCIRIPQQGAAALSETAQKAAQQPKSDVGQPELRLVLPAEGFAEDRIEGWVLAVEAGTDQPYRGTLPPATLDVQGPAKIDRTHARLAECASRFFVEPSAPGTVMVTASCGELRGVASVDARPSQPKPRIVWEFEEHELTPQAGYDTEFPLSSDASVRPNQRVARINMTGVEIGRKQTLIRLDRMPDERQIQRSNIRGVFFDMMVSGDFACEDPDARVEVIMQSPADWWMVLGGAPLAQATEWKTYTTEATQQKHIDAMPYAHNVWFVLRSSQPIRGSIYIDRVGFMVR